MRSSHESLSRARATLAPLIPAPRAAGGTALSVALEDSPLGPLILGAVSGELVMCDFWDTARSPGRLEKLAGALGVPLAARSDAGIDLARRWLEAYFKGQNLPMTVPLRFVGTPFQKRVWEYLGTIPFGEIRSYADEARALGNPRAVRAVAQANGRNPISILVPCHRVIGSDGSLTGYSSGMDRKVHLLTLEGIRCTDTGRPRLAKEPG